MSHFVYSSFNRLKRIDSKAASNETANVPVVVETEAANSVIADENVIKLPEATTSSQANSSNKDHAKSVMKEVAYKPLSQLESHRSATSQSAKKQRTNTKSVLATNSSNADKENLVNESTSTPSQRQSRKITVKPRWEPNEAVMSALDSFRQLVTSLNIKLPLTKSAAIPHSLDEGLLSLHKLVLNSYSVASTDTSSSSKAARSTDFLRTTTGYYEAIVDILGGQIPPGRVKLAIYQQECKDKAMTLRTELDSLLSRIRELIPGRIVAIATPDDEKVEAIEEAAESESRSNHEGPEEHVKCAWNVDLRQLLMKIEDSSLTWAAAENMYRRSLSASDKLLMSCDDEQELDYKAVIINTLTSVSSYFPTNCVNIDVSSLRKQISTERARARKTSSIPTTQITSSSSSSLLVSSVKPTVLPNLVIPPIRITKEKPEWQVNQRLVDDLAAFRTLVLASNIKLPLAKSAYIPHSLDDALFNLHKNVKAHVTLPPLTSSVGACDPATYLNRTTGYYEAIAEIFGGQISISRIKSAIYYTEFKHQSEMNLSELERAVDAFKNLIVQNVVEGTFEEKLQSINETQDRDQDNDDAALLHEVPESSNDFAQKSSEVTNYADGSHVRIYYKKCTWGPELRLALFNIDVAVSAWCKSENSFRAILTVADRKVSKSEDCEELKEREVLAQTLQGLASMFPTDCLHADIASIRHYLQLEKRR